MFKGGLLLSRWLLGAFWAWTPHSVSVLTVLVLIYILTWRVAWVTVFPARVPYWETCFGSLAQKEDFASSEVTQGKLGNCWWESGVATLCNCNDLLERVCVTYDQACGVYGFVYYRDGGWIYTIVDDYLYLSAAD